MAAHTLWKAGLLGALLLGAGCGGEDASEGEAAAPAPAAGPAAAKEKRAAAEGGSDFDGDGDDSYTYNPIGKRDPFRSFISAQVDDEIRSPTPLQRFEVDQYHLVGIVWGGATPRAMVQDPEGTGHVIELGTYIGKNWGKVTQITSREVVITEEYQNMEGDLITNQVIIDLPLEELPLPQ